MIFCAIGFLAGSSQEEIFDACTRMRQESFFYYLFGVQEPGVYGSIEPATGKTTIFVPKWDQMYKIWMTILEIEEFQKIYQVEVKYIPDMEQYVRDLAPTKVFLNCGVNSDSGLQSLIPTQEWLKDFNVDKDTMYPILANQRVYKSPKEIEILRLANKVGSEAHIYTMRHVKPAMRESQAAAHFKFYGEDKYNCKHAPYNHICGCGPNAAVLHYPDAKDIMEDGGFVLFDMGHEMQGYDSDITCSYPINGKFTQK